MLQIKFDCNRPAGLKRYSCLKVWTHARTPARVPSYKLTLWAFGSSELKTGKGGSHVCCLFCIVWCGIFCVERFLWTFNVIRSIIDVIYSISYMAVFSLMISIIVSISSLMCFCLFSQYSNSILVKAIPKFKIASSHLSCKAELTTWTCGVKLILRDFGIDHKLSHLFK